MDKNLLIERFVVGPLETNCYVVADARSRQACLIDPGAEAAMIQDYLDRMGLKLECIINTHGHGDHIAANSRFAVPIYIHTLDADFLTDTTLNLSKVFMFGITSPKASRLLEEGDAIPLGSFTIDVLHTPGHTPGSISLKVDGAVFTGDALFAGSVGRTDFSYGDQALLIDSIARKLYTLGDDVVIYPGHGEASTIGEEKRSNPYVRGAG